LENYTYCHSLTEYKRRKTIEVKIGNTPLGGNNPIRVQSMTTCDTMDTDCTVQQAGINTPLVADIHYTPNAAMEAAKHVEKVRINPGNFADKKKFETLEYTDDSYQEEIDRIKEKFIPLIAQCKKHNTALRIGTNHGSLSDRILSRYGDTPMGMVESALEFVRICEGEDFFQIVLSMKSSNTRVMVQAYRLLVNKLEEEGLKPYPLHLGVTEAGDGEDGRIKSSVGIGTLLEDGLGDTIRVSLTEEPELEMPVAATMVKRYSNHKQELPTVPVYSKNPFKYAARETHLVLDFGGDTSPRVVANFANQEVKSIESLHSIGYRYIQATDKWISLDTAADYIYLGKNELKIGLPSGLKAILSFPVWNNISATNTYPIFTLNEYKQAALRNLELNFLAIQLPLTDELPALDDKTVLVLSTNAEYPMPVYRQFILGLMRQSVTAPVVLAQTYDGIAPDDFQLFGATDIGGVLIDGLGNGIMIKYASDTCNNNELANKTAFGILQAARTRMSKTEYISCPSCGRTLFDLQQTTAKIKEQTDHLKGVKIGIMGCIVNGPGEMADADYGYVGAGIEKISLYKGQEVVQKGWVEPAPVIIN